MGIFRSLLFGKYLMITNTVSCGMMMGFGDLLQQRGTQWKRDYFDKSSKNLINDNSSSKLLQQCINNNNDLQRGLILANTIEHHEIIDNHDFERTKNMITVGLLQGPFNHYFYIFLDRLLPGKNVKTVVKKTFIDQIIASPLSLGIFFIGLGKLENRSSHELLCEIKEKFFDTYKIDCCFWPPSQLINFLFVPMRYRVIYINLMTMFYDIFLSHTKYVN